MCGRKVDISHNNNNNNNNQQATRRVDPDPLSIQDGTAKVYCLSGPLRWMFFLFEKQTEPSRKHPGWWGYLGDEILPNYRDYKDPIRIPIKQTGFNRK